MNFWIMLMLIDFFFFLGTKISSILVIYVKDS
jgi:hypothetical protein